MDVREVIEAVVVDDTPRPKLGRYIGRAVTGLVASMLAGYGAKVAFDKLIDMRDENNDDDNLSELQYNE